jgi:hypothetical protein
MRPCISTSVNFASTLRMPTSARDLRPGLDCFTMGAAIFAIFCCQTSATGMFTTVLVLIVHNSPYLIGIGLPSDLDLIQYLLYVGDSGSEFFSVLPFIGVVDAASES